MESNHTIIFISTHPTSIRGYMYKVAAFLTPFIQRFHGKTLTAWVGMKN
jgi:hypothetical protein